MSNNIPLRILGISPGTRSMGIGILNNNQLTDWRVKTDCSAWSKHKLKNWLSVIDEYIKKYDITVIVIKHTHSSLSSNSLNLLNSKIKQLALKKKIIFYQTTIKEVERHLLVSQRKNKEILSILICERYPQLYLAFKRHMNSNSDHYISLFEAVACACYVVNDTVQLKPLS